jgi:hypothetical protein
MGLLVSFPKKVCLTSQLGCNVFFCILTYYVLLSENIVLLLSLLHQYIKHQFYTTPTGRTEKTNGDRCNKCGRTSPRKKNWSHQWVQCDSCDGWYHLWVNSTLHVLLATKWLLLFLHLAFLEIEFFQFFVTGNVNTWRQSHAKKSGTVENVCAQWKVTSHT